MTCRNCGAGLEAGRIDAELGVITCSHCGSLHDAPSLRASAAGEGSEGGAREAPRPRPEVTLPERFNVQRGDGSLEVTWPVGSTFGGIILCGIGAASIYVALSSGQLPVLLASAAIFYFAANQGLNSHRVRVDRARIDVSQGPVPWRGARQLDAADVEQLFATEHESRVETGEDSTRKVEIRRTYRLAAKTRDGKRIVLLKGLGDAMQALWLEHEIESLLGIGDSSIAGAHTG